jgi:hypothetical protein
MRIPRRKVTNPGTKIWRMSRKQKTHRSDQREKVVNEEPIQPVFRNKVTRKDENPNDKL